MKSLAVLVAPGILADGVHLELDDTEQHHLRVRRASAGADILLLDGAGDRASGRYDGRGAVTVGGVHHASRPADTVLAVGAGDRERFLALAERCTELGVTALVPLVTEYSQAVDSRFRDSALDKARRRAREACKQSENAWATAVAESCRLGDLGRRYPGLRWFLADPGALPCPPVGPAEAIGWLIGPEGGWADGEIADASERMEATAAGLGPAVLRFDTAAVAAATITHDRRSAARR